MAHPVVEKLDRLAEMEDQVTAINLHFDELRDQLIPESIRVALEALEAERETALQAAADGIAALKDEIRQAVLAQRASVKGSYLRALYSTRISWNTKGLNSYAVSHPEVLGFRKQTNFVTIRAIRSR